jgi:hypothetical protein
MSSLARFFGMEKYNVNRDAPESGERIEIGPVKNILEIMEIEDLEDLRERRNMKFFGELEVPPALRVPVEFYGNGPEEEYVVPNNAEMGRHR